MDKLNAFVGRMVGELGSAMNASLALMGDKLGLYKAMAGAGPLTSEELAERTGTTERYVREWLAAQAAGGYVDLRPGDRPLHAAAGAGDRACRRGQPGVPAGAFQTHRRGSSATSRRSSRRSAPARASAGTSTTSACSAAPSGSSAPATTPTRRTSGSRRSTASSAKLERGAKVADVGCGHGASTIIMAQAFPNSHVRRLRLPRGRRSSAARAAATEAGVGDRVRSRSRRPRSSPAAGYDLVAIFDCLHDMGDPVGAARARPSALAAGRHLDDRRALRRRPRSRTTSTRSAGSSTRPRP